MRKYQRFTKDEIALVIELKEVGQSNADIANRLGREPNQIKDLFFRLNKKAALPKEEPVKEAIPAKPEKNLNDFQPRDIIKHLYNLGYRIDKDGLYVITKQRVNLQSVINE